MSNQKIKNIDFLNTPINEKSWASLILAIRKKYNFSQSELAKEVELSRFTIMRSENCQKIPRKKSIIKILYFIRKNNLDINILMKLGSTCIYGFKKDTKIQKLNLKYSVELAEFIGILLGDGEIMKDGTLRISFDPRFHDAMRKNIKEIVMIAIKSLCSILII